MQVTKSGTPVPNRNIEQQSKGSGDCITRPITPEELKKFDGIEQKPRKRIPHNLSPEEQRRRAKKRYETNEEDNTMTRKPKYSHVTKELLEKEFAAGKTATQIEREQDMPPGTLSHLLKKYGVVNPRGKKSKKPDCKPPQAMPLEESMNQLRERCEALFEENEKLKSDNQNQRYEQVILDLKKQIRVLDLHKADQEKQFKKLADELAEETEAKLQFKAEWGAAKKRIAELEDARSEPVEVDKSARLQNMIVLQIPVIDGNWAEKDQKAKVDEELAEFAEAASIADRTSELYDLIQAYVGMIRIKLADLLDPTDVDHQLQQFFDRHNKSHAEKIQKYAAERGSDFVKPDREKKIGRNWVQEYYWAGDWVVYVNNRLYDGTFDDAVANLSPDESQAYGNGCPNGACDT